MIKYLALASMFGLAPQQYPVSETINPPIIVEQFKQTRPLELSVRLAQYIEEDIAFYNGILTKLDRDLKENYYSFLVDNPGSNKIYYAKIRNGNCVPFAIFEVYVDNERQKNQLIRVIYLGDIKHPLNIEYKAGAGFSPNDTSLEEFSTDASNVKSISRYNGKINNNILRQLSGSCPFKERDDKRERLKPGPGQTEV